MTAVGPAPLTAAQRSTAYRYAADLLQAAQEDPVDREALILAASQLADSEGHRVLAGSIRRTLRGLARPTATTTWRERLADRGGLDTERLEA